MNEIISIEQIKKRAAEAAKAALAGAVDGPTNPFDHGTAGYEIWEKSFEVQGARPRSGAEA